MTDLDPNNPEGTMPDAYKNPTDSLIMTPEEFERFLADRYGEDALSKYTTMRDYAEYIKNQALIEVLEVIEENQAMRGQEMTYEQCLGANRVIKDLKGLIKTKRP